MRCQPAGFADRGELSISTTDRNRPCIKIELTELDFEAVALARIKADRRQRVRTIKDCQRAVVVGQREVETACGTDW